MKILSDEIEMPANLTTMQQEVNDEIGLEIGSRVAGRLREQPALLQIARDNLAR